MRQCPRNSPCTVPLLGSDCWSIPCCEPKPDQLWPEMRRSRLRFVTQHHMAMCVGRGEVPTLDPGDKKRDRQSSKPKLSWHPPDTPVVPASYRPNLSCTTIPDALLDLLAVTAGHTANPAHPLDLEQRGVAVGYGWVCGHRDGVGLTGAGVWHGRGSLEPPNSARTRGETWRRSCAVSDTVRSEPLESGE